MSFVLNVQLSFVMSERHAALELLHADDELLAPLSVSILVVTHQPDLDLVLVNNWGDDHRSEEALGKVMRQFPLAAVLQRGPGGPLPDVIELPVEGTHGHPLPCVRVRLHHPPPVRLRLCLEADCLVHLALVQEVL